jgi:hypothetical protein
MRYGVCVVNPLGGQRVMEQWCDSHEAAELEVAPRAGMRLLAVRLLL